MPRKYHAKPLDRLAHKEMTTNSYAKARGAVTYAPQPVYVTSKKQKNPG